MGEIHSSERWVTMAAILDSHLKLVGRWVTKVKKHCTKINIDCKTAQRFQKAMFTHIAAKHNRSQFRVVTVYTLYLP